MKISFSDCWAPVVAGGALFICATFVCPANANMLVSPMTSSIDTKSKSASQLRVYSKSDATQYVKVVVKRVLNPATEQEVEEDAPRSGAGGVMVSPAKFALPAGGSRLIRVIALGSPAKEELYRVHFEPVASPTDEASGSTESINSNVDFGLVWAPLVRVLPSARLPAMAVSGGVLKNTGNMRLAVLEAGACDSEKSAAKCDWQPIARSVYPGQSFKLPHAASSDVWQFKYRLDGVADVQEKAVRSDVVEVPGA